MLVNIEFRNYRGFSQHTLPLKPETIIVGRNNAGKSTVIEGFRLASIVTERYKNLSFKDVPEWLEIPIINRGVQPSLTSLNLSWENIFHRYQDLPASIIVTFGDEYEMTIYLGKDHNGYPIRTKSQAQALDLPRISVLPQVAPLTREETYLDDNYVRRNMSSYLASLHFRNQLRLYYEEYFADFKTLVESTWSDVQIRDLEGRDGYPDEELMLLVRDGDFVAEAGWMGHGLQMWLQTMWFLARTSGDNTVVLDEPDVYMHQDLQRRLLRLLRGRHKQLIVATHSTEILSEAEPSAILILDRNRRSSIFTTALPAVQRVLEEMGSVQNIQLTKLWNARRLILVEGKDIKLLRRFQDLLFPGSPEPIDGLPHMPIGGWSGWPYAVGSAKFMKNAMGEKIIPYCILDSDYYPEEIVQRRYREAVDKNVQLHIWRRKEIENYLIVPEAVERVIHAQADEFTDTPTSQEIRDAIDQITEDLKDATIDALSEEIHSLDRRAAVSETNKQARIRVEESWGNRTGRLSIVSGKNILSKLSFWSQENFKVSFGVATLAGEIRADELADEVVEVMHAIERRASFATGETL